MKKKIFMAGVGGMLGEAFYYEFLNDYNLYCTDKDVNEKWLNYLDFCEKEKYKSEVLKFNPDYLFHIGAFTDLEYCEKNKDETIEANKNSVLTFVINRASRNDEIKDIISGMLANEIPKDELSNPRFYFKIFFS